MENIKNTENLSDASYLLALIYKHKWAIIIVTILSGIASIIVSLLLPVWYASSVNFVPPQESGSGFTSGTSGISAVMKDFGLSKIGGSKGGEYSMIIFFSSRTVIDSIIKKYELAKVYDIPDTLMTLVRKEFLNNSTVEYTDEGNYILTVWDTDKNRAAQIANDYVGVVNSVANRIRNEELTVNVNYLKQRINSIDSTITIVSADLAKISKENLMFSPEAQAQAASTALGDIKTTAMQYEFIYDFYKKMFGENDPETMTAKEMFESANAKIKDAYSKPGFIGNFALTDATPVAVEYLTKYADIEALTKTKALLVTTLEKTVIDKGKSISNFFVIDQAIPADKKDKPKRAFIVAGGTASGFIICILVILIVSNYKMAIQKVKNIMDNDKSK